MAEKTVQVAFRFAEELVARIDRYAGVLRDAQPGLTVTRADVVRILLTRALDAVDAKPNKRGDPR